MRFYLKTNAVALLLTVWCLPIKAAELPANSNTHISNTQSDQAAESVISMDRVLQDYWGLTTDEWERYKLLKPIAQALGQYQVEPTPLELLGIYARSESERQRYAIRYVERMDQYVAGTLVFQRTIAAVQREFYKDTPMIDVNLLNKARNIDFTTQDTVAVFVNVTEPCLACDVAIRKAIAQVEKYGLKLDVFFNSADNDLIQNYAAKTIPPRFVVDGRINLSANPDYIARYQIPLPTAFISRNGGNYETHDLDL